MIQVKDNYYASFVSRTLGDQLSCEVLVCGSSLTESSPHIRLEVPLRFLNTVENDLVCDILIWCHPFYGDRNDETSPTIACDLDEG